MQTRLRSNNTKERITELKIIGRDCKKLDVNIDDLGMMTKIISNLLEEYQTIVRILEDKLDDK